MSCNFAERSELYFRIIRDRDLIKGEKKRPGYNHRAQWSRHVWTIGKKSIDETTERKRPAVLKGVRRSFFAFIVRDQRPRRFLIQFNERLGRSVSCFVLVVLKSPREKRVINSWWTWCFPNDELTNNSAKLFNNLIILTFRYSFKLKLQLQWNSEYLVLVIDTF